VNSFLPRLDDKKSGISMNLPLALVLIKLLPHSRIPNLSLPPVKEDRYRGERYAKGVRAPTKLELTPFSLPISARAPFPAKENIMLLPYSLFHVAGFPAYCVHTESCLRKVISSLAPAPKEKSMTFIGSMREADGKFSDEEMQLSCCLRQQ
jgi:hypothetical protein